MQRSAFFLIGLSITVVSFLFLAAGPASAGSWSTVGEGTNNLVRALAFSESGTLYAGGDFTTAGGSEAIRVASWDGSQWSPMGSGINGAVYALVVDGANVYAGGTFSVAGGVPAYKVARWNGGAWSAVGVTEYPGIYYGTGVYAMAVDSSGNLYVGGSFSTVDGTSASNIARWNGVSWSSLGSGLGGQVWALVCDDSGNLYAGGAFSTAGGVEANYIAKWDGSSWSALGEGIGGYVDDLAKDSAGNIYAVGRFNNASGQSAHNIARWDGSSWNRVDWGLASESGSGAYAVVTDGALNVYTGGYFYAAASTYVNNVAHWDGSGWLAMGDGVNSTVFSMVRVGSGSIVAGGNFGSAGGVAVNNIARWDEKPSGGGGGLSVLNLLLSR